VAAAPVAAAPPTRPVGKLIAGLQVRDELARGGLGIVYLAYHPMLKDFRAIKRPRPNAGLDGEVVLARFRREVEALGTLRSKHIVRAHDAGADHEGPYLVTEYLDGEPLSRLLERHGALPVGEACELIRQAALGLQAAHECSLVHRDIKLSNLVLTRDGPGSARVVIVDWGLVKQAGRAEAAGSRLTTVQMQMGTPDFLSPEQIRDAHGVDIRSDIYSLGVTLYCLLAGQPPFANRSEQHKLAAQLREPFPPLAQVRPDVPAALLQVLDRMVRKNPAERYQTPAQVVEALQRFCSGEPRLLLALLAPVPAGQTAPVETKDTFQQDTNVAPAQRKPSTEETMLVPQGPVVAVSRRPRRRGCLLAAVAGIFLSGLAALVAVVVVVVMLPNKDDKTGTKDKEEIASQAQGPLTTLKEDFHSAFDNKQLLPKDWEGEAYRVGKDNNGEPCLELGKIEGTNWVKLPPVNLSGNFFIAGVYYLHPGLRHTMTFRLESSKGEPLLGIVIMADGKVSIHDEPPRNAPTGLGVGHDLLITRKGTHVSVWLNGMAVATRDLKSAPDYDIVKINLTPDPGWRTGGKLFQLTIGPGADGIQAAAGKSGEGKKK
jgi:tRNA A-37 threonylcarbamoyl transferase component Bud32